MKLKKFIAFFVLTIALFTSCEKDEICLEENTPNLIIRFYDIDDPKEYKKVVLLRVQIDGTIGDYEGGNISELTDSIAIPIRVTDNITKFRLFITQIVDDVPVENEDVFDLSYIRSDIFISRSCGYKTLFNETSLNLDNDTDNWIKAIEIIDSEQNILNEKSAHVKIFH